jgi:hypothetical protein
MTTIGFNKPVELCVDGFEVKIMDIGGVRSFRHQWTERLARAHACIFVVDCADVDRLIEACDELGKSTGYVQFKTNSNTKHAAAPNPHYHFLNPHSVQEVIDPYFHEFNNSSIHSSIDLSIHPSTYHVFMHESMLLLEVSGYLSSTLEEPKPQPNKQTYFNTATCNSKASRYLSSQTSRTSPVH